MNQLQPASFDSYARHYDAHFTYSLTGRGQRRIVHDYISSLSDKNVRVLEVNCGTGEDALLISKLFDSVLCTDASEEMIKICRGKTNLCGNVATLTSSIQNLEKQITETFGLVISNFGGLNCLDEDEMKHFAEYCRSITDKTGEIILVIMGRKCLWERFYFRFKKNRERAMRRLGNSGARTVIKDTVFQTYYYSPREIKQIFGMAFEQVKLMPVGFFIPPSYLNPWFQKHQGFFSVLCSLEKTIRGFGFLADFSDHYLIHLKRK